MKINLKNIAIESDKNNSKIIINNDEYDRFGNLIEKNNEKYINPLPAGTIIDYDSEHILILENNGYIGLGYFDNGISYIDYDWAEDPRVMKIYEPFKNKKELSTFLSEHPDYIEILSKYYKKSFFKK